MTHKVKSGQKLFEGTSESELHKLKKGKEREEIKTILLMLLNH